MRESKLMEEIIQPKDGMQGRTTEEVELLKSVGVALLRTEMLFQQLGLNPFDRKETERCFKKLKKYVTSYLLRDGDESVLWGQDIYVEILKIVSGLRGWEYDPEMSQMFLESMGQTGAFVSGESESVEELDSAEE